MLRLGIVPIFLCLFSVGALATALPNLPEVSEPEISEELPVDEESIAGLDSFELNPLPPRLWQEILQRPGTPTKDSFPPEDPEEDEEENDTPEILETLNVDPKVYSQLLRNYVSPSAAPAKVGDRYSFPKGFKWLFAQKQRWPIHTAVELTVEHVFPERSEYFGGCWGMWIQVRAHTVGKKSSVERMTHTCFVAQPGVYEKPLFKRHGVVALLPPLKAETLVMTSRFGIRAPLSKTKKPISKKHGHPGSDFRAPTGTPIFSIGEGIPVFAGASGGYGNLVVLLHRNHKLSYYAHLSQIPDALRIPLDPKNPLVLPAGSLIGHSGCTGLCLGAHLHLEWREAFSGTPLDPGKLFKNYITLKKPQKKSKRPKNLLAIH